MNVVYYHACKHTEGFKVPKGGDAWPAEGTLSSFQLVVWGRTARLQPEGQIAAIFSTLTVL